MCVDDLDVIRLLRIDPSRRSTDDLKRLLQHLRSVEGLVGNGHSSIRDTALLEICRIARPLRAPGDTLLYKKGELTDCWYILLTGSVLIESSMFLPRNCLGTRLNASPYRQHDCFVLEDSDLIVIDYLNRNSELLQAPCQAASLMSKNPSLTLNEQSCPQIIDRENNNSSNCFNKSINPKTDDDSESGSSGSDVQRISVGSLDCPVGRHGAKKSPDNLSVMPDRQIQKAARSPERRSSISIGDSDDEDFDSSSHESLRDSFMEALLKEPTDRTHDDIEILIENVQNLPAFSNLSSATRYALANIMLMAVVHEAGQVVLSDGELLDAWSVILNGTVEIVEPDGTIRELSRGDSLGVRPVAETQRHRGQMRTVTEDCQFICVAQADFVEIMARDSAAEIPEVGDGGRVVLVYENTDTNTVCGGGCVRSLSEKPTGRVFGPRVVLKGTPDKLIEHLMSDVSPTDTSFPEDLLLTYRTFLSSPLPITSRLLHWYRNDRDSRSRVKRYVLLWVHNHFNDFDDRPAMLHFLNTFDELLLKDGTAGERRLFHLACSTKAIPREVAIDCFLAVWHQNSSSGQSNNPSSVIFPFVLVGSNCSPGIFINEVDENITNSCKNLCSESSTSCNSSSIPSLLASPNTNSSSSSSTSSSCLWASAGLSFLPCSKLRRGDQLLAVCNHSVLGMSLSGVARLIANKVLESNGIASFPASLVGEKPNQDDISNLPSCLVVPLVLTVIYNPLNFFELKPPSSNRGSQSAQKVTVVNLRGDYSFVYEASSFKEALHKLSSKIPDSIPLESNGCCSPIKSIYSGASSRLSAAGTCAFVGKMQTSPQHQMIPSNQESFANHMLKCSISRCDSSSAHDAIVRYGSVFSARQAANICSVSSLGLVDLPLSNHLICSRPAFQDFVGHATLSKSSSQPDLALLVAASEPRDRTNKDSNHRHRFFQADDSLTPARVSADSTNISCRNVSFTAPSTRDDSPIFVIRIWRSSDGGREQSSKLVALRKHTTALEATRLAAEEFGVSDHDRGSYCLCQVTVEEGPITKQSRIADHVDDLSSRTFLNSRYYLKCNRKSDPLVNDDVARLIFLDSKVSLLQTSIDELTTQLTLSDYSVFRSVEAAEYVDKVFGLVASVVENGTEPVFQGSTVVAPSVGSASSGYSSEQESNSIATQDASSCSAGYATGFANLDRFSELVNREAYWVPSEICGEPNLSKRVDALKRFIKMAKLCRDLRNYNTMFCILVGLNMAPVERLRQTWERLPNKYAKLCRDLALVLDPSRNFFHYRNLITAEGPQAPMIPYLPLILKDLTFIHLGNSSRSSENLVNFSKLRMIAKEVRALRRMCSAEYDLSLAQRFIQAGSSGSRSAVSIFSGLTSVSDMKQNDSTPSTMPSSMDDQSQKLGVSKKSNDLSSTATVAPSFTANASSALVGAYSSPCKRSISPNLGIPFTIGDSTVASLWPSIGQIPTRRRSNAASLKKLHESWLVNLRVRTYLSTLHVIDDLDTLTLMSYKIEPGSRSVSDSKQVSTVQSSASVTPTPIEESSTTKGKDSVRCNSIPIEVHSVNDDLSRVKDVNNCSPIRRVCEHKGAIFGAQSLEDTRKMLMLNERARRNTRRVPYFFLPTSHSGEYVFPNNTHLARTMHYPANPQLTIPPSFSAVSCSANNLCSNQNSYNGPRCHLVGSCAGHRWSMESSQSFDLRSLNSLIPTTARLAPSTCQHSHQHNQSVLSRQNPCLRSGYFVDNTHSSCKSSQHQVQQIRRAPIAHQDQISSQRMVNPQSFNNRCIPVQRSQQQDTVHQIDHQRLNQRPSANRYGVRAQLMTVNSPPSGRQNQHLHHHTGISQPPLRLCHQPEEINRPQPPPYEHALGLRQQRSALCNTHATSTPYSTPPLNQNIGECDLIRRNPGNNTVYSSQCVPNSNSGNCLPRSSSQCPSMCQPSHHLTQNTSQLSDNCRSPPLSRPSYSTQRSDRPPLPSYNQAVAMKQEKPTFEKYANDSLQTQNSYTTCSNIRDFRSN